MKKNTLKLLCLLLTLCICLPFTACDNVGGETTASKASENTEKQDFETAEKETETETTAQTEKQTEEKTTTHSEEQTETETLHEHSYTSVVTPPTCTEEGYTTYTCSCGDTYTDDFLPATGTEALAAINEIADSLFADIDRENITNHVEFIRDFENGVHAEYYTNDLLHLSYSGKIIQARHDIPVTVSVRFTKDGMALDRSYSFVIKAGNFADWECAIDDDSIMLASVTDCDIGNSANTLEDLLLYSWNAYRRSIIIDFTGEGQKSISEFDAYIAALSEKYGKCSYETLELQGDTGNVISNRKIKVTHEEPYGYNSMISARVEGVPQHGDEAMHANFILRQRASLDSPYRRADDFDDFGIYKTNTKGTMPILRPDDLVWYLEEGYLPEFPYENSLAEYYYESAKMILREIITDDMTETQKVLAIYEYVNLASSYSWGAFLALSSDKDASYSMIGFFDFGEAVCSGLNNVFKMLCMIEGIEACGEGDYNHAWAYVKVDGKWYGFCTTWSHREWELGESTLQFAEIYGGNCETMLYTWGGTPIGAFHDKNPIYNEESITTEEMRANSGTDPFYLNAFQQYKIPGTDIDYFVSTPEEVAEVIDAVTEKLGSGTYYICLVTTSTAHSPRGMVRTVLDARGYVYNEDYIVDENILFSRENNGKQTTDCISFSFILKVK